MTEVPAGHAVAHGDRVVLSAPTPTRRSRRSRDRRRWVTIALFLAPALALYLLLVIAPVVQAMYYSGFAWNGLGPLDDFVGLENFKRAFSDDVFTGALKHNGILVLLSLVLQLPFALGVALILNERLRGRAALRDYDWLKKPFSISRARSSAETSTLRGVRRKTLSAMRCIPPSSA